MIQINKKYLDRYSRQIILKNIGILGQKKISLSKILVVGAGGLGCPVSDLLCRAGVGEIGIVDNDKISISNLNRQTLFNTSDINKYKVDVLKKKLNQINPLVKINTFKKRINEKNINNLISNYEIIVDGSDNFNTKFLLNEKSLKFKKKLIVGAISRFDGHIFVFNFKNKNSACLKCFYQEKPSDELLNCDQEGILGTTASIIGSLQANEILKSIIGSKNVLKNSILIFNTLNLRVRIVKFKKIKKCVCV
jgi:molybdopterin/thiamine biosynthesis adenylyltransferase|tara:strand:+ start:148 stop:897 length:750 start_codon:yes stop_codon:yes gene_type:complete